MRIMLDTNVLISIVFFPGSTLLRMMEEISWKKLPVTKKSLRKIAIGCKKSLGKVYNRGVKSLEFYSGKGEFAC